MLTPGRGALGQVGVGEALAAGTLPLPPAATFDDDQWSQGTCDVVNGSATVAGVATSWTAQVLAGHLFVALLPDVEEASAVYVVDSVAGNEQLTLTAPWAGPTIEGAPYVIHRRIKEFGVPRFRRSDEAFQLLYNHGMVRFDNELRKLGA